MESDLSTALHGVSDASPEVPRHVSRCSCLAAGAKMARTNRSLHAAGRKLRGEADGVSR